MRCLFVLSLSVLLYGCVTGGSTLDQSAAASITNIHIVAIEGPPLSGVGLSRVGLSGGELVVGGTTLGSSSLLIIGGVMMLADISKANQQSATASRQIESLLDQNEIWEPTQVIAEEASRQLAAKNNISVSVEPNLQRLPGVEQRDATFFMENWMAPLRSWYNESPSTYDYTGQPKSGVILEIGLLNYELTTDYLLVQVVTKLVDPSTGVLLANARSFSNTKVEDVDKLFENDADGYKRFFQTITAGLVEDCIADMGLR